MLLEAIRIGPNRGMKMVQTMRRCATVIKSLALAILFVFSATVTWSRQPEADQVDDYVKQRMHELQIPGLSMAVVKEGRIVKASGYGMANVETSSPATPETVYKAASLSKPFIAAAILLLMQEGRIGLDDKVSKYVDDSPEKWKGITVRHLLTHTSGIVRDPVDYHPYNEQQPITDVIRSVYPLPLSFQPGDKWLYSNVGYYVLAEIITKVSGKPWDKFITERLFAPAHMISTRTTTVTDVIPLRANGYQQKDSGMVNAENWIAVRPSGAFLSTVLDLAKWDVLLDSGSPIKPSSRKLMWTPVTLNDKTRADYGFGWYVDSFLGRARIHHDGQFPGFRSDYEHFDDDKLTVIVLANSDNASLASIALKVAGFYAPELATPPFSLSANVPSEPLRNGNPITIKITAKDDGKAAPDSVVEMEIWDEAGHPVYKQDKQNESFDAGQTNSYTFVWTPGKAGRYTINIGAYGPHWSPSYSWQPKAATITVN
jgi:CubicO group peptidase (beta-lactamase class C family)